MYIVLQYMCYYKNIHWSIIYTNKNIYKCTALWIFTKWKTSPRLPDQDKNITSHSEAPPTPTYALSQWLTASQSNQWPEFLTPQIAGLFVNFIKWYNSIILLFWSGFFSFLKNYILLIMLLIVPLYIMLYTCPYISLFAYLHAASPSPLGNPPTIVHVLAWYI